MAALDGLTGLVFGAVIGSLFVITCIISAIKAVRDRRRIKKRRAMRKRSQLENACIDGKNNSAIEEIQQPAISCTSQINKPLGLSSDRYSNGTPDQDSFNERLDLSVYAINTGVDNLTFEHSNTNIQCTDNNHSFLQKSNAAAEIVPFRQNLVPKRAKSHDPKSRRERNLDHLSADCLAIKKCMRRHSYEIAVCENSWLPKEPVYVAQSNTIRNAYNYGGNVKKNTKSTKVAFVNKAYEKNDYKKT